MINDGTNNIEFAEAAIEKHNQIIDMIKDYIKEFDVIKLKIAYTKEESVDIKLEGSVVYNIIYP
jgi:hypothetical protein